MTEFEALKKTATVWQWLAEHPEATKEDAYRILKLPLDKNLCALCEYDEQFDTGEYCPDCLLAGLWLNGCCSGDSPYRIWVNSEDQAKVTQAAWDIADYAFHLIDELQRSLA